MKLYSRSVVACNHQGLRSLLDGLPSNTHGNLGYSKSMGRLSEDTACLKGSQVELTETLHIKSLGIRKRVYKVHVGVKIYYLEH